MKNRLAQLRETLATVERMVDSANLISEMESELNVNVKHSLLVTASTTRKAIERYPQQVRSILQHGECIVKYVKRDGSEKTARCTRGEAVNDKNDEVITYWDLDEQHIRAFNINRMVSIERVK